MGTDYDLGREVPARSLHADQRRLPHRANHGRAAAVVLDANVSRFWDKLYCSGYTYSGHVFALVYDQKSRRNWIIYRLGGGSSLADLGGRP
jgi:hypothetical protein